MATREVKTFSKKSKKEKGEPIPFELEGADGTEKFLANPTVPGATILELVASSGESGPENAKSVVDYLRGCMNSDQYKKFDKFIKKPENEIELDTLIEVVSYLIEEQSSRPTEAS